MTIKMNCPECGLELLIDEKFAGKSGRCKKCNFKFSVPEQEAPVHVPTLGAKGSFPNKRRVQIAIGAVVLLGAVILFRPSGPTPVPESDTTQPESRARDDSQNVPSLSDPDSQSNTGNSARQEKETPLVNQSDLDNLQKKAEEGNSEAQFALARAYDLGDFVDQDESLALKWYEKAGRQGHLEAQVILGEMYTVGRGMSSRGWIKALRWYETAASQGHADAQFILGEMYTSGRGTSINNKQSFRWYREAAKQGHTRAQQALRVAYEDGIEFVWIPAGDFEVQSPTRFARTEFAEELYTPPIGQGPPTLLVAISKGFWLSKYEITQEQWDLAMPKNLSENKGPKNPVENVSWDDIQDFILKLNKGTRDPFRLPTEAEWEYACRAGTNTTYSFGSDSPDLDEYGWHKDNSERTTHPVGQRHPNAWGLYDMHGNVSEWCQDWKGKYPSHLIDPTGAEREQGYVRIIRGGSAFVHANGCRARQGVAPRRRSHQYGFRIVKAKV